MKGWTMLNLALVMLFTASAAVLVPIIYFLGLWLKGATTLAFPALGLILPTPLIVISLIVMEVALVMLAAYLVRYIPTARL
jgi:hypothetical protein